MANATPAMNPANALGFVVFGIAMWLLPIASPGWFPHSAVDGSSTRALWLQVMGVVQCGVGVASLFELLRPQRAMAHASQPVRTPAVAQPLLPPEPALAVEVGAALSTDALRSVGVEPSGSITLQGDHAVLWRALNDAMQANGQVRQMAIRLFALVQNEDEGASGKVLPITSAAAAGSTESEEVVAFTWEEAAPSSADERELAEQSVA